MKMIRSVGKESPKTIMCLRCIVQRICLHTPNSRSKISSTSFSVYPRPARTESCPICISITQKRNSASDCKKKRAEDVRGSVLLSQDSETGGLEDSSFVLRNKTRFSAPTPKTKQAVSLFFGDPACFVSCYVVDLTIITTSSLVVMINKFGLFFYAFMSLSILSIS